MPSDKIPERFEHLLEEENYKGVLEEGLDKRTCRSFRDSREWVLSKTWDMLKNEGYDTFEEAEEKAWDLLDKKCKKLGVPEGEVGGAFPKPKSSSSDPDDKEKWGGLEPQEKPKPKEEQKTLTGEKPKPKPKKPEEKEEEKPGLFEEQQTLEKFTQEDLEKFQEVLEKMGG